MGIAPFAAEPALCRPWTASHFEIQERWSTNGISAELRRYIWQASTDGRFRADAHYIDYSLVPRHVQTGQMIRGRRAMSATGDVAFVPKGESVDIHCDPGDQRLLCLMIDDAHIDRMMQSSVALSALPSCNDVRAPRVRHTLSIMAHEVANPGFCHDILIETMTISLLVELFRYLESQQKDERPMNATIADWRLRKVRDIVADRIAEPLSIIEIATECGMSARHLIRTFKQTTGMTLSDYIAQARVAVAKRELLRRNVPIKCVAAAAGFQSPSGFSAAFRRATGLTPKEFQRDNLKLSQMSAC